MNLHDILIPSVFLFALVAIIKIVSDNKVRRRLIEKELINENLKYLYAQQTNHRLPSSLKWGFVLVGIGLAFILGLIMPGQIQDEVTIASMFILAGLGFLLYYYVSKKYAATTA